MADDGELVESGTFRVDRQRVLEKLKEFQLPDPALFLLSWVRCAVASGATEISIESDLRQTRLMMSFDGQPFSAQELQDPYAALLDETTTDNVRNRHLAIGILAALALNPETVAVTSGTESERRCLRMESLERDTLGAPQTPSSGTVLELQCSGSSSGLKAAVEHVVRHYQRWRTPRLRIVSPYGVDHVLGGERPKEYRESDTAIWSFSDGAVRGCVVVPENPDQAQSTIRLYHYSVLVEEIESEVPPVPVVAAINSDRLTLNVSQSGVVRDDQFEATMQTVVDQTKQLLVKVSQAQGESLMTVHRLLSHPGGLGRRLSIGLRSIWEGGLSSGLQGMAKKRIAAGYGFWPLLFAPPTQVTTEKENQVLKGAWITAWLRKACATLLHKYDSDSADPTLKALWETPIFLSTDGPPLSLAELELQRRQLGHVPISMVPGLGKSARGKVVWCVGERDRTDLEQFFPGQTRM